MIWPNQRKEASCDM